MKKLVVLNRVRAMAVAAVGLVALAVPLAATAADKFEKFAATAQIVEVLDFNVDSSCQPASPGTESTAIGTISGSGLGTTGIGAFTLKLTADAGQDHDAVIALSNAAARTWISDAGRITALPRSRRHRNHHAHLPSHRVPHLVPDVR